MGKYSVIDLFAGAGGLSLGFVQTQKYEIKAAFENNLKIQKTYKRNHPGVELYEDVCDADYSAIEKKFGKIDVVIGGPPCQGFSNANRQKNHTISKNNMMVKQYIRAILELQPKAFIMENVSMLKSDVHRFFMEKGDKKIVEEYHIPTKISEIHLLDADYLFDGIDKIVANPSAINAHLWPESIYYEINVIYKAAKGDSKLVGALSKHKNRLLKIALEKTAELTPDDPIFIADITAFTSIIDYYNGAVSRSTLIGSITPAIMIQRMLQTATEIISNNLLVEDYSYDKGCTAKVKSFAVFDYLTAILGSKKQGYVITSDVLCAADYGAPQKRNRFVVMGVKKTIAKEIALPKGHIDADEYITVYDAISDLEKVPVYDNISDDAGISLDPIDHISELGATLRNSPILYNHIVTKTTDVAMARFKALKQGENFHSLSDDLKTNTYTDVKRTQNTIYLRLNYCEACGTVVNVRKSMWIHPTLNRAISVREAARLQTFPDSFVFCGTKDSQYQQVGNAVPPILAKSIAKKLAKILAKGEPKEISNGR